MAATSSEHERGREDGFGPPEDIASASTPRAGVPWPLEIISAAVFGALVSGLVAFVWGCAALVAYSLNLSRAGFFKNWLIVATYTGRTLSALTILVLATAALGAVAFPAAVLIRDRFADPTSAVRLALDHLSDRLRHSPRQDIPPSGRPHP